jgi:hypothetical protein
MDEATVTIWPLPSHVIAVLAHQRAVKAVKCRLRAKGLRPGASLIAPSTKSRLMLRMHTTFRHRRTRSGARPLFDHRHCVLEAFPHAVE